MKIRTFIGCLFFLIMMLPLTAGLSACTTPEHEKSLYELRTERIGFELSDETSTRERAILRGNDVDRLLKVFEKAEAGESLVIGYIGGSITQGSGASTYAKCYVSRVNRWWLDTFPDATFEFVNAGVGGTDSMYGCERLDDDLLSKNPDFVITEFSVNDGNDLKHQKSYMELCERILDSEREPAVVCLSNIIYDTGICAQDQHLLVAYKLGLPFLSMKKSLYQDMLDGVYRETQLSSDGVHPNDHGYELIADCITYYLEKVYTGFYSEKENE